VSTEIAYETHLMLGKKDVPVAPKVFTAMSDERALFWARAVFKASGGPPFTEANGEKFCVRVERCETGDVVGLIYLEEFK